MRGGRGYRPDRGRDKDTGFLEEVLAIRAHTKVTKGGRTLSFGALVAVGDGKGKVGLGYGKARGVPMAIEKANKEARQNMVDVPLVGDTVCHEQVGKYKAARILLKPAAPGTGVKAGATVRAIMTVLGIHNVLTKSIGRNNPINLAKATMKALAQMRSLATVEEMRQVRIHLRHPQHVRQSTAPSEAPEQAPEKEEPQPEGETQNHNAPA